MTIRVPRPQTVQQLLLCSPSSTKKTQLLRDLNLDFIGRNLGVSPEQHSPITLSSLEKNAQYRTYDIEDETDIHTYFTKGITVSYEKNVSKYRHTSSSDEAVAMHTRVHYAILYWRKIKEGMCELATRDTEIQVAIRTTITVRLISVAFFVRKFNPQPSYKPSNKEKMHTCSFYLASFHPQRDTNNTYPLLPPSNPNRGDRCLPLVCRTGVP